jgi:ATP-dependent DNA helicase PIF1
LDEEDRPTDIVAPTGIAALNVGGTTAYTYAGWNPNFDSLSLKKLHEEASGKKIWKRLNKTSVLIIDEISMISSNHFRRLNKVMQEARDSKKPFGYDHKLLFYRFLLLTSFLGEFSSS